MTTYVRNLKYRTTLVLPLMGIIYTLWQVIEFQTLLIYHAMVQGYMHFFLHVEGAYQFSLH